MSAVRGCLFNVFVANLHNWHLIHAACTFNFFNKNHCDTAYLAKIYCGKRAADFICMHSSLLVSVTITEL
jgi:hypothetical protein